jgi:predicted HTH domain antitoxin
MSRGGDFVLEPTIVLETLVPEDIYRTLQASGLFRDRLAEQSRQLLAMHFYRDRVLSLGKAARLAGLSHWDFIDLLSHHQIPVIDYSREELAAEFQTVEQLQTELRP